MNLQDILQLPPDQAALYLLGATIYTSIKGVKTGGVLSELEAYLGEGDLAAHGSRGRTPATCSLYREAGTLYVHTMRHHVLMDVVTQGSNTPSSLLIRSFIPTIGIEVMCVRRNEYSLTKLARGPGNVCKALGIDRSYDGSSILTPDFPVQVLLVQRKKEHSIVVSPRIGITKNTNAPLRFRLNAK